MIKKINLIGAGNVATHLADKIKNTVKIITVFSKSISNANELASKVNSIGVNQLSSLSSDVDLNIVCLKDDVIKNAVNFLPKNIPVVHTSGSIAINVFNSFSKYGILYPLQTFSKTSSVDVSSIPFLIEGNSDNFTNELLEFCKNNLSAHIHLADSELRKQIHLSAVISNNFLTALLRESEIILNQNDLNLSILKPLLFETLKKSFDKTPLESQTGPAKRLDYNVINAHIQLLENEKLKQLYQLLTELIIEQQKTTL